MLDKYNLWMTMIITSISFEGGCIGLMASRGVAFVELLDKSLLAATTATWMAVNLYFAVRAARVLRRRRSNWESRQARHRVDATQRSQKFGKFLGSTGVGVGLTEVAKAGRVARHLANNCRARGSTAANVSARRSRSASSVADAVENVPMV